VDGREEGISIDKREWKERDGQSNGNNIPSAEAVVVTTMVGFPDIPNDVESLGEGAGRAANIKVWGSEARLFVLC